MVGRNKAGARVLPDTAIGRHCDNSEKVEEIDISRMLIKLKECQRYHELIGILESSS